MKRKFCIFLLILLVAVGAGAEVFYLRQANITHQREMSTEAVNELIVQIGIADSAMRGGDQARFERARQDFGVQYSALRNNRYFNKHQAELMARIDNYANALNSQQADELRDINIAARTLLFEMREFKITDINYADLEKLDRDMLSYNEALEKLSLEQTKGLRSEYLEAITSIRRTVNELMVCVNVCTEQSYAEKRAAFDSDLSKYSEQLETINASFVEYFGASELLHALDDYIENS